MKILIIGEQNSGKTTLRKAFEGEMHMLGFSTSDFLFYRLSVIMGISEEVLRGDKETWRHALVAMGNDLCNVDPGIIVSACLFKGGSRDVVIDGVRRTNEFEAVVDSFDLILYVDRPSNHPKANDNFELQYLKEDPRVHVVYNSSTIHDMFSSVEMLMDSLEISV